MSERLSLSRAARLVGVSRGVLQKQIRDGALATFEGKVSTDDLAHHFPSVSLEPADPELARVNQIKEKAFGKRVFERALPDKEVLAARLAELGKDITRTRAELSHYQLVMQWLDDKFDELAEENNVLRSPLSALKTWLHRELAEAPEAAMVLEASESYRQVVAPHVRLTPSDDDFFVEGSETLLEAALRAGIAMNYGCSNGNCGCCKARMVSGQIKKVHPHDFVISEAEKNMGYALMCANTAVTDVVIDAGTAVGPEDLPFQQITAQVEEMAYPSDDVLILRLKTPRTSRLRFLAGQHVTLRLAALPPVNFTVASCPCEARRLEFHLRRAVGNPFSDYVFHRVEKDALVDVE
ncbi:MAG TPA: ferredoxin, partial [Betaproteobacteria bacterium]|nr:ferredoxin [Betaproteobacteria bacterium]